MTATKIYARQVPPERQESPFFDNGYQGVNIYGNPRLRCYKSILFDGLPDALDALADAWAGFEEGPFYLYHSWADALADLVTPKGRPEYTREERKKDWPELVARYCDGYDEPRILADALTLITGRRWDCCTLRGCCQGDWQECVYDTTLWDGPALERLEAEYFNTGSEWHIYQGDDCGDCCGAIYCHEWSDDGIRREIADAAGVSPEDVTLYKFTGYAHVAQYEEV